MLHYLPFAALSDADGYLIDRFSLRLVPSADTLVYLKGAGSKKVGKLLAFGNPDLGNPALDLPNAARPTEPSSRQRRRIAAAEIFRQGCAAAEPVPKRWFADVEFRDGLLGGAAAYRRHRRATTSIRGDSPSDGQVRLAQAPPDQDVQEFELQFPHGVRLDVLPRVIRRQWRHRANSSALRCGHPAD